MTLPPTPHYLIDMARLRANMEKVFPALKGVPTLQRWAGVIDATLRSEFDRLRYLEYRLRP